jgi:DNA-binding transcriptional LysR family regulator
MVMDVHGRDLRYFVAVAEDLHFTRAAERLFISQPALSKQIRMLERQLGAPLFDRRRDGVRLTAVGEALLPHARSVLARTPSSSQTFWTSRSSLCRTTRGRFGTTGWPPTPAAAGHCGSAPRSPAPRRLTRHWPTGAAYACWPPATRR